MRVPLLVCYRLYVFPWVGFLSRVTGIYPVTTDLTMRVNVRITTINTRTLAHKIRYLVPVMYQVYIYIYYHFSLQLSNSRVFTLSDLLDKPWSAVGVFPPHLLVNAFIFIVHRAQSSHFSVFCARRSSSGLFSLRPFLTQSDSASRKRPFSTGLFPDWILLVLLFSFFFFFFFFFRTLLLSSFWTSRGHR